MDKLKNFFRLCGIFFVCLLVSAVLFLVDPLIGIPMELSLILIGAPWVGFVVVSLKMDEEEAKKKADQTDEDAEHE